MKYQFRVPKIRRCKQGKTIFVVIVSVLCVMLMGCGDTVEEGIQLLGEEKYTEAQDKFEKAIQRGYDVGEAYRGLGLCYWEQEEYEKAEKAFGHALDAGSKETATIYNMLGICALKTGKPEKSVYYFKEGQEFSDASEELVKEMAFNLIVAYEEVGDYVSAKEELQIYVEQYPDDEIAAKELEFLNTQVPEKVE